MHNAPLPTEEQIERVRDAIGAESLAHAQRIESGLSCTMDILEEGSTRMVLRRYGPGSHVSETDAAAREARALELMQRANIPAPAPIWIDTEGVFDEQALVISYVDGETDLTPAHPFEWAEQLATVLTRIHDVRLDEDDADLFPPGAGEDMARISESPEVVLEHRLGEDLLRRRVTLGQRSGGNDFVFSHTDYWPGNTMWRDGTLTAVVDWESPATGEREMDVAYCSLDIRYLGMDRVADHFVETYREVSGDPLANLPHWEAVGLCRPMPDIAQWVPAWTAMGRSITEDQARERYTEVLEDFLERTA
ncbi:MAG TPA: phosphotransferase [Acidimicrobiia bacterium]|jgi:aminoglycoside phosphotransferase (APT) family kinase protein|nr:phosphotransferase [Acidimicrobiia bacterium]